MQELAHERFINEEQRKRIRDLKRDREQERRGEDGRYTLF